MLIFINYFIFLLNMDAQPPLITDRKMKRIIGLPKNVFFLGLTSFFNDFSSEMVFSAFPAFFTSVLKAGAGALGLVDGIAEGLSNFFKVYSGGLSDKIQRRKPLVLAGYALSVITRPFYILAATVGGALGLRVLDRVGKGLRDSPRDAIISLSVPPREMGKSFGYHRAMDTMGSILGPLTAYLILKKWPGHFDTVFMTAFFVGIAAILSLFFISEVAAQVSRRRRPVIGSLWRLPVRLKIFVSAALVLSIGSLPIVIMLLKTSAAGLVIANIPLFYMVYSISYAAFSIPAGKLSDRIGVKKVVFIGYLILLLGYFFVARAQSFEALAASFLFLGLFPAFTDGTQRSLVAKIAPEDMRGGALGALNAAVGVGALLAGIGGGFIWQRFGPGPAFMVASLFVVAGLMMLLAVKTREVPPA